jgi:hypothetical protein
LDITIFKLLKSQAIEVLGFLLAARDFAAAKGFYDEEERLKDYLEENKQIISIADTQMSELEQTKGAFRLGLFDTINPL